MHNVTAAAIMPARSQLSNQLRRARLRGFLDREAHEGGWWAVMADEDMRPIESKSDSPHQRLPEPLQMEFARKVADTLNRSAHFHGVWVFVWFGLTKVPTRYALIWKDWDGDIQVFGDDATPFPALLCLPDLHWAEHGHTMIETWLAKMQSEVSIREDQTVHLAAGERPSVAVTPDEEIAQHAAAAGLTGGSATVGALAHGSRRRATGVSALTR